MKHAQLFHGCHIWGTAALLDCSIRCDRNQCPNVAGCNIRSTLPYERTKLWVEMIIGWYKRREWQFCFLRILACLNINFLMVKIYDKGRVLCKGKQNIILFILFSIFNVLKLLLSDLFSIPIVQKMLLSSSIRASIPRVHGKNLGVVVQWTGHTYQVYKFLYYSIDCTPSEDKRASSNGMIISYQSKAITQCRILFISEGCF